jgi:hypothetical protein
MLMNQPVVAATLAFALPAVAFVGGAWLMNKLSGRKQVPKKPINRRFHYSKSEVVEYWKAFQDLGTEKRFLELDLVFPLLYGGALAAGMFMAWAARETRPFHLAWIVVPLAITLLSDWTENLVHLNQLKRYRAGGPAALDAGWIRVASTATALKLSFFYACWLILLFLIALMFLHR